MNAHCIIRRLQRGSVKPISLLVLASVALAGAEPGDVAEKLFEAARKGDSDRIRALIAEAPEAVRAKDRGGNTALHHAARLGDAKLAAHLLAKGADVNALNRYGATPLAMAAAAGKTEVLSHLLKHGADPNRKRPNADGVLNQVARSERADALGLLRILIAAGADVNARGYAGDTPLASALRAGNRRLAEVLIKAGADINAAPTQYRPPPLHEALDRAAAELLLEHGARVDCRDFRGRSALHQVRTTDIAAFLLGKGLDVNVRGGQAETPLHALASEDSRAKVLEYLVRQRADVSARDKAGRTPLHYAALGREPAVKSAGILLTHGADVNCPDKTGRTPLHVAADRGHAKLAKLLVEKGADVAARDIGGRTPLHLTAAAGHADTVKILLGRRANVNTPDQLGWTPLHQAVVGGQRGTAELLIAAGAEVNVANRFGETPLFWARGRGRTELTALLAKHGAKTVVSPSGVKPPSVPVQPSKPAEALAEFITSRLKFRKGLALDLGCGDGGLAAALAGRTLLFVHCVDTDEAAVAGARRALDKAGLYGVRASAAAAGVTRLAFPTSSANLVVCRGGFLRRGGKAIVKEVYRVLSPNGVAMIGQETPGEEDAIPQPTLEGWLREAGVERFEMVAKHGLWARVTKPRPEGSDEWRFRFHDPGNSYGSEDRIIAPPMCMKWFAAWHPGTSSAGALVGDGRLILVGLDYNDPRRGPTGTPTPFLQAIDVYTGTVLWTRQGREALPFDRSPRDYGQVQTTSDIALVGGSLYVLAGKACYEFDAATGSSRDVFPIPASANPTNEDIWVYLSCVGDVLYGASGPSLKLRADWCTKYPRGNSRSIFAIDRATGRARWVRNVEAMVSSFAIGSGRLYYFDPAYGLHALEAETGQEVWVNRDAGFSETADVVKGAWHDGKYWVLFHPTSGRYLDLTKRRDRKRIGSFFSDETRNSRRLAAFDARDGRRLFTCPIPGPVAGVSFTGKTAFTGAQHQGRGGVAAVDTGTGQLKWRSRKIGQSCSPTLATPNCVLIRAGVPQMLDYRPAEQGRPGGGLRWTALATVRPTCALAGLPANGMLFVPGPGCFCPTPLRANLGLAPGRPAAPDGSGRLVRGPAFAEPVEDLDDASAWPTWRADLRRSGQAPEQSAESLRGRPRARWSWQCPGQPTPVAATASTVFVGATDHKVYGLDVVSGQERWRYIARGAVRVAPFYSHGRLYVSDDDGWAHCLRARDGALIWRFRAAPAEDRVIGNGRLVSRWPARAGVVVDKGVAYVAAGYEPIDKAMVCALDAASGDLKWEKAYSFSPTGPMALHNDVLYVPTGVGMPVAIDTKTRRPLRFRLGGRGFIKAERIAVFGGRTDILCASARLTFVYHLGSYTGTASNSESGGGPVLPIATDQAVYLANGRHLTAHRRDECRFRFGFFTPRPDKPKAQLWSAWGKAVMTALIEAGGVLLSGGTDRLYATEAASGKQLWSADVPGEVRDVALGRGRLFVVTDSGKLLCLARSQ